jgi:F-type H+-transporting ATPase subunit gamma
MNFRQVKKKIKTVGNVKKITKAMQMVSAVKMKKAQRQALDGRLYREQLEVIISKAMEKIEGKYSDLLIKRESNPDVESKKLYILISSNKGLCGSFNFGLLIYVFKNTNLDKDDYVVIGKKAADFLARLKCNIKADFSGQLPFIDNVSAVFSLAITGFLNGDYDEIDLVYNKFISTSKSITTKTRLLPIEDFSKYEKEKEKENILQREYIIEPSPEEIVDAVLRDLLKERIKTAIFDSEAAEHSARMLAMKNATDNATDIIYNLTLEGNKLRQASITSELLDMISALQSSN